MVKGAFELQSLEHFHYPHPVDLGLVIVALADVFADAHTDSHGLPQGLVNGTRQHPLTPLLLVYQLDLPVDGLEMGFECAGYVPRPLVNVGLSPEDSVLLTYLQALVQRV